MKIKTYIYIILWGMLLFSSCLIESLSKSEVIIQETRGVLQIEVTEQKEIAEEDRMQNVRLLVFKNTVGYYQLEINEYKEVPAITPGEEEATKLKILLEVGKKQNASNEKLVVAIVNEPPAMKITLDGIGSYDELEHVKLLFADFLNTNHTGLQPGRTLPMTGMVLTDKVYDTPEDAWADPASIELQRAVARVDFYIGKEAGVSGDLANGTTITLKNTYNKGNLLYHQQGAQVIGTIPTIAATELESQTWTHTSGTKEIPEVSSDKDGLLVCSFYTPERTCTATNDTDKLILKINLVSTNNETRTAEVPIDEMYPQGGGAAQTMEVVRRNNNYKIIATVEDQSAEFNFLIRYSDWIIHDQEEDFD